MIVSGDEANGRRSALCGDASTTKHLQHPVMIFEQILVRTWLLCWALGRVGPE
jgi:hypothetical protein